MAAVLQQLPRLTRSAALLLLALAAGTASAQSVVLAGRMGERALLVIDGTPYTTAVGQTVAGVKLRSWSGDQAQLEHGGKTFALTVGATPVQLGAVAPRSGGSGREIVLVAGPGGHFSSGGAINGKPVRFVVDTGATMVAIGKDDAARIGIDLSNAQRGMTQTANGAVPVAMVTLSSVRVGDVELANVAAVVLPTPMPVVLLGNSFLSRMQMRRENDVMRLELR